MSFLRPAALVKGLGAGDFIQLSVLELEVRGQARVVAVEPCPPIEEGFGRVVTGAFQSQSIDIWLLKLQGLDAPIEVTGNHPIFSEDRQDFTRTTELCPGERLRARSGVAVLQSLTRKFGGWNVFNLEVAGDHQYFVSEQIVLVHNGNGLFGGPSGFSDPELGGAAHEAFDIPLMEKTGTEPGDWQLRTGPGETGVDATYIGPKSCHPGYDHAELKPYTDNGYLQFQKQLNRWQLPPGKTRLWFYDEHGNYWDSGINY